MITFQIENKQTDLKVPVFIKIKELLEMISEALEVDINSDNRLQAEPLGRILDNEKTLEEETVTQGSLLTVV
ncbi:MAG: EsaB/YukD family protein [Eubacteriales bacterium]